LTGGENFDRSPGPPQAHV